jgi:hypothetical protein
MTERLRRYQGEEFYNFNFGGYCYSYTMKENETAGTSSSGT